jgi:hypothetical protein
MSEDPEPYKFSITKDPEGWRWEILSIYWTWRGGSYFYEPLNYKGYRDPVFGVESTREAAIEAGKKKCEQMTQIYMWRTQREVFSSDGNLYAN